MRVLSNFKFTLILLLLCVYVSVGQNLNCGIPSWYDDIAYADPGGTAKVYSYVEYNGKVYINNKYIGSTCKTLKNRLSKHKSHYKYFLKGL